MKLMTCNRCGREMSSYRMSWFNTQLICVLRDDGPSCADAEEAHPLYNEARVQELLAVEAGVRNYPGIGLPEDLVGGPL